MLSAFSSGFLVFATIATALFQLGLVLGAPLGEYAFGGQQPRLSSGYRVASAFSFILMLAIAGHYLAQLDVFEPLTEPSVNSVVNWLLFGFFLLSAFANNLTKSTKERRLWSGPTIAMALAAFLVAL